MATMPSAYASPPPARRAIACPLCGKADGFRTLYTPWNPCDDPAKLYGAASGIPGTQTLVECPDCTMIFESPRFPDDAILAGYLASEEGGHDSQFAMRVESFYRALVRLKDHLPPPGARVLDIGTAGGAFLDAATRYGYDANGLEPSRDLTERGKKRGLKIEQGTIADHALAPGSFDMVCLWDVIEHLTDPRADLERIRKLLKPDGILLVNFPDIGTTQAKLAGKRFWWILSVHLHHFTRRTMADIMKRTGFEPFHFRRYWQTLQFGYLEDMAAHYRIPLTAFIARHTPRFIREIPVPYYASQTTALARVKP